MRTYPACDAVRALAHHKVGHHLQIPLIWRERLTYTTPTGRVKYHDKAAQLLAYLKYRFNPIFSQDEDGNPTGVRQFFRGEEIWLPYAQVIEVFPTWNKSDCRGAFQFLEDNGLVEREFRTYTTEEGLKVSNVHYVKLVAQSYIDLCTESEPDDPELETPYDGKEEQVLQKTGTPIGENCKTNTTEGNTEGPTERSSPTPPGLEPDKDHPAIQRFREKAHRYPKKVLWEWIAESVGSEPDDVDFWGEVVFTYIALGWNPTNVQNMMEYFLKRELPSVNKRKTQEDSQDVLRRWAERNGLQWQPSGQ